MSLHACGLTAAASWPNDDSCSTPERRASYRAYIQQKKDDNPTAEVIIYWPEDRETIQLSRDGAPHR